MSETAAVVEQRPSVASLGLRAVRAAYWAFVLSIPIETIIYFKDLKDDRQSGGVTITRLLGILVFGLALVNWRECFRKIPAAFWPVAWYLAAVCLSQLFIPQELDLRFRVEQARTAQMVVLFLLSANLLQDRAFRSKILRHYGWVVSLVAVAMLAGLFGDQGFGEDRGTIATQDPNLTAALYAIGAVCLAGDPELFAARGLLLRLPAAAAGVAALTIGILQTGSRGGLLALLSGILGLVVCGGRKTRAARVGIAFVLAGALSLLVVQEFQKGSSAAARLERAWSDGDTSGRTQIYDAAWAMFLDRPLMGYGAANNRFRLGVHMNFDYRDMHNSFLAFLTEVGLVGALPMLATLLYALWAAWRAGSLSGNALPFAPLVALLVMNASVTGSREKIFWVLFAAAVAAGREAYENSDGRAVSGGSAADRGRSGGGGELSRGRAVAPSWDLPHDDRAAGG